MKRKYTVILEKEDQGYHVFCPVLPGCHSQGETVEEALRNITEAIGLYIESIVAHGEELPRESQILIAEMEIESDAQARPQPAEAVARIARKLGFTLDRQKGSHAVYLRATDHRRVVIPMHAGDLKLGTLRGLIDDMGLTVEEFLRLV